jgi:hypothetical protein
MEIEQYFLGIEAGRQLVGLVALERPEIQGGRSARWMLPGLPGNTATAFIKNSSS